MSQVARQRGIRFWYIITLLLLVAWSGLRAPRCAAQTAGRGITETILKQCKAAAVLVDLGSTGSGSGFCISAQGHFITNRHVVASLKLGAEVTLVLQPSSRDQKILHARIVRIGDEQDLALLKVTSPTALTPLTLGDDAHLMETAPVTVFGYPFGKMLSENDGGYPAISVNTGKVTAIRKKEDKISAIQIDAAVNPGNSGGPMIDDSGKVIGVIVSGIAGSGINFAIPVSEVRDFLSKPGVVVSVPPIHYADRAKPIPFNIQLVQYPSVLPSTLELMLLGDKDPRKFPVTRAQMDSFTASATPLASADTIGKLKYRAKTGDKTDTGEIADAPVKIGGKTLHLIEIRRIEKRPDAAIVTTVYNRKYAGPISGLGKLPGAGSDFSKADVVDFWMPDVTAPALRYQINVIQSGQVVASVNSTLQVDGLPSTTPDAPKEKEKAGDIVAAANGAVLAWWRFENENPRARMPECPDSSGNGNDLSAEDQHKPPVSSTHVQIPIVPVTGDRNISAVTFAANSSAFYTQKGAALETAKLEQWTLEASVSPADDKIDEQQTILCWQPPANKKSDSGMIEFLRNSDGDFVVRAMQADGTVQTVTATLKVKKNKWYHLAAVADGKQLKVYINMLDKKGYQLQGSVPFTGAVAQGGRWSVGCGTKDGTSDWPFKGTLDEVRITGAALPMAKFLFGTIIYDIRTKPGAPEPAQPAPEEAP